MKINYVEIKGYEDIEVNIDTINNEIKPVNMKENFSCADESRGGLWYRYRFGNIVASVICNKHSYGGTLGLWEIGIIDYNTEEFLPDNPYIIKDNQGVEGFKSWKEIQSILNKILVDTMKKV